MRCDKIEPIMSNEKLLPTRNERDEHFSQMDNIFDKVKVSAIVGLAFTGASMVFPPALPGAVVAAGEVGRQVLTMNLEFIKYHHKYPGVLKK